MKRIRQFQTVIEELAAKEGWRALEASGKRWSSRHAAGVDKSQSWQQAQRREDPYKQQRQDRNKIRTVTGRAVQRQQAEQRRHNCDDRKQQDSVLSLAPWHRSLLSRSIAGGLFVIEGPCCPLI
jgi:hypothetical protein